MQEISNSIRPKKAAEMLGISAGCLWRWVKEKPGFPRPRKLSPRCTVFDSHELIAWRDMQGAEAGK